MAANRINYLVFFTGESQVYGSASKDVALATPPPEGVSLEQKRIVFVTYQPDAEILSVHPLPQEEILSATLEEKKKKKSDEQEA